MLMAGNGFAEDAFEFSGEQQKHRFYKKAFSGWAEEDAGHVPAPDALLAIGSSSMRGWRSIGKDLAPMQVIHRGFGGSQMKDVLLYQSFFNRYKSNTVLVYEGDNDLARKVTPEEFTERCKAFVESYHSVTPDAKIYFLSVKPSIKRANLLDQYRKANELLKAYCDSQDKVEFIDVFTLMMGEDGQPLPDIFLKDDLHMNPKGYAIWTKIVREKLGLR